MTTSNQKQVTAKEVTLRNLNRDLSPVPDGSKFLQGLHKVSFHNAVNQAPDMNNWGGRGFVGVIVVLLRKETDKTLFPD
jgi:hypothetical protein